MPSVCLQQDVAMNTKRFARKMCVLCESSASSPAGEHVWPKWLLTDVGLLGPGPYTMHIDNEPTRKRSLADGSLGPVRSQTSPTGTRVPMCADCNGVLNARFEVPAKDLIRSLTRRSINHTWPTLTANEARCLALWLLKVGLLLKHPKARHDDPDQDVQAERWSSVPRALLVWMIDEDEPPAGLSVFLSRRDESLAAPTRRRIPIPAVRVGNEVTLFLAAGYGLRGIDLDLVFHPGWPLRHALVDEGSAARIWPDPGAIDIEAITPVHPRSMGYLVGGYVEFRAEAFPSPDLPPLSCDTDFFELVSSGFAIATGR